jgi:hypothetical protein
VAAGTCSLALTTVGARTLTASYVSDVNFSGSTSAGAAHTVNEAATTTTITSDLSSATVAGVGYTVNFTVAAVAPGSGTPTGNVTVSDGTDSCIATVAAGGCTLTSTTAGAKSIIATYAASTAFLGSASTPVAHTVN